MTFWSAVLVGSLSALVVIYFVERASKAHTLARMNGELFHREYRRSIDIEEDLARANNEMENLTFYFLADPDIPIPIELTEMAHAVLAANHKPDPRGEEVKE